MTADEERNGTGKEDEPDRALKEAEEKGGKKKKEDPKPSPWGNWVRKNQGQVVNAGRVDGGVHYHHHIGEDITRRLRRAARLSTERVNEVLATFCPSDSARYATFQKALGLHGVGVITGKSGTGRAFTAVHALAEAKPDTPIEQLTVDPTQKDAGISLINVDSGHSRFLDLTPLPELTGAQQVGLRGLVGESRKAGALMVIIAGPGQREEFLAELQAWLHIDEPARAEDVFQRTMERLCGAGTAERWLEATEVQKALEGAEPARALRLAQEAHRSRPSDQLSEEEETLWIKQTLEACADVTEELARWFKRNQRENEFRRVLLATVALLEGAHRSVIVHHAHRLAREWYVPSLWQTPISGDGLTAHLWEIGAHVRDDRVHFNRRGHGDDALDYLWREHPGTRTLVETWATEAVADLESPQRFEAARRWLGLARRHRDEAPVAALIEHWGDSYQLMWAAIPALAEAAVTPELGTQVRSALYRAVTASGATLRDRTVLEVCRVYGRVQPSTALTRIRHIAAKVPAHWDELLIQAVEDIAGEPGNIGIVVEALVSWHEKPGRGRVATVASLALCRLLAARGGESVPRVMIEMTEGQIDEGMVIAAWRAASHAGTQVGRPLWGWLDVLESGADEHRGFDVLCHAARGHERLSPAVKRGIGRWKHAHGRRAPALDGLSRWLDESEETR